MIRMRLIAVATSAAMFSFAPAVSAAADGVEAARRAEEYYVAAGKTYNMHAHDHARMLGKYAAASDKPVPKDVVAEHVAAIGANVEHARKSFSKLAAVAKQNPSVAKQLAEVEKRLSRVSEQVANLKAASAAEATDTAMIVKETAQMAADLKATHTAGKEIDAALAQQAQRRDAFYDPNAPSYYSTGEGHFID